MSKWIRESHRWVAMTFLLIVIVNVAAFAIGQPASWLYYLPLPPLFWLMLTGLYMFVLPYARKGRAARAG